MPTESSRNRSATSLKSITIHGVDEPLVKLIKSKAKEEGLSINQTIKNILGTTLGVKPKNYLANAKRFEEFCGIWSKTEVKEFDKNTEALSKVDSKDWS
ncbi:MAG: hypothetical protein WAL90_20100 [Desulfobacterales bacterium]